MPAVPAHGPDEPPINVEKRGILSHSGSGMLKEAGVMDVRVVVDPSDPAKYEAYYTDHFGGLVVATGAGLTGGTAPAVTTTTRSKVYLSHASSGPTTSSSHLTI